MSKKRKSVPAQLAAAQQEIMELIWDRGEVTVAEMWEILVKRHDVARNTVQTMIVRMEEKWSR